MKKYLLAGLLLSVGCSHHSGSSPASVSPVQPAPPLCGTTMLSGNGSLASGAETNTAPKNFNLENGDSIIFYEQNIGSNSWTVIPNIVACGSNPTGVSYELIGTNDFQLFDCSGVKKNWMYQATVHGC